MKKIFTLLLALTLAVGATYAAFAVASQRTLAHSMLRLRVIGAGDSPRDQEIKLLVRDRMLSLLGEESFSSRDEAIAYLAGDGDRLVQEVDALLAREGADYTANITVGNVLYPECVYNTFSLPAGRYVACTVTLGAGEGKNWWCVLFPPLCYGMEPAEEYLETGSILLEGQEEPEIVFRFRILEWIEKIKHHWEG